MRIDQACRRSFARHESFVPRYGWFRKAVMVPAEDPRAFSRPDATVAFGVGRNMVNAIRYWGLAAKLIVEGKDEQGSLAVPTEFGLSLFGPRGWDPWLEDPTTLWLLHWRLMSPPCLVPVWWYAFNQLEGHSFTREELTQTTMNALLMETDWNPKQRTVFRDVVAFTQAYAQPPDNGIKVARFRSPLAELDLLSGPYQRKRYQLGPGDKRSLPKPIITYIVLDYLTRRQFGVNHISFQRLATEPGSPGRALRLSPPELQLALEPYARPKLDLSIRHPHKLARLQWTGDLTQLKTHLLNEYYGSREHSDKDSGGCQDRASRISLQRSAQQRKIQGVFRAKQMTCLSSLDLSLRFEAALAVVQPKPLPELLAMLELSPLVAARHSAEHNLTRIFVRRFVDSSVTVKPFDSFSPYDGEVLLVTDGDGDIPRLVVADVYAKPTVVALPSDMTCLAQAAREMAAWRLALYHFEHGISPSTGLNEAPAPESSSEREGGLGQEKGILPRTGLLMEDPEPLAKIHDSSTGPEYGIVPRDSVGSNQEDGNCLEQDVGQELHARVEESRACLRLLVDKAFSSPETRWLLLKTDGTAEELRPGRGSASLSEAADLAFPHTPVINNEMLNTHFLSSPGRKARRVLLEALLSSCHLKDLGFEGYGPEVAMYKSVLENTGIHYFHPTKQVWRLDPPQSEGWQPVWKILQSHFSRARIQPVSIVEIYVALMATPVGIKRGVIPILLAVSLLLHPEIRVRRWDGPALEITAELLEEIDQDPGGFQLTTS